MCLPVCLFFHGVSFCVDTLDRSLVFQLIDALRTHYGANSLLSPKQNVVRDISDKKVIGHGVIEHT